MNNKRLPIIVPRRSLKINTPIVEPNKVVRSESVTDVGIIDDITTVHSVSNNNSNSNNPSPIKDKNMDGKDEQPDLSLDENSEPDLDPDTEEEIEIRKRTYPKTISIKRNVNKRKSDELEFQGNIEIAEEMRRLAEHIRNQMRASANAQERKKHGFRLSSINKGIDIIENCTMEITSGSMAAKIDGIGKGISARIDEILRTGTLSELQNADDTADDGLRKIAELTGVTGIGDVKARELIKKYNLNGINDLIERWKAGIIKVGKHELTHHMEVGLRWYHDIRLKIPRNEMEEYSNLLIGLARSIDPNLTAQVCGSFRRGRPTSGDVDVLLTYNVNKKKAKNVKKIPKVKKVSDDDDNGSDEGNSDEGNSGDSRSDEGNSDEVDHKIDVKKLKQFLPLFVSSLRKQKVIVDSLTDESNETKYMGVSKLHPTYKARRIDIRFVEYGSFAAAQFYFTGSGAFNKLFRGIALQRGYTLNEYGIYKLNEEGKKGELVKTYSERQIFDVVGIEYLAPNEREF